MDCQHAARIVSAGDPHRHRAETVVLDGERAELARSREGPLAVRSALDTAWPVQRGGVKYGKAATSGAVGLLVPSSIATMWASPLSMTRLSTSARSMASAMCCRSADSRPSRRGKGGVSCWARQRG